MRDFYFEVAAIVSSKDIQSMVQQQREVQKITTSLLRLAMTINWGKIDQRLTVSDCTHSPFLRYSIAPSWLCHQ